MSTRGPSDERPTPGPAEGVSEETQEVPRIESRAYGPDATDAERRAIVARVELVDERIVRLRELPVQSAYTVHLMFDRVEALVAGKGRWGQVLDLRSCARPDAEAREAVKNRLMAWREHDEGPVHSGIVLGNNVIMRAVARLVSFAVGISFSLHATEEEAVSAVRHALR